MTTITDEFLKNELDFDINSSTSEKAYKDYYFKICQYVFEENAFRPTPDEIEQWIEQGYFEKAPYFQCRISEELRPYLFKRAIGLQLIYDSNNGRNSMIKGTDGEYDVSRETFECLNLLQLIQPVRW